MNILKQFILLIVVLCLFCTPAYSRDGALDETFSFTDTVLFDKPIDKVLKIKSLPYNSTLAVFSLINTPYANIYYLTKLLPNGDIDNSFAGSEIAYPIFDLQGDGKIIVVKRIDSEAWIMRLFVNGRIDDSFIRYRLDQGLHDIKTHTDKSVFLATSIAITHLSEDGVFINVFNASHNLSYEANTISLHQLEGGGIYSLINVDRRFAIL